MKRKILSLILVLAMVLPLVPVFEVPLLSTPASAATNGIQEKLDELLTVYYTGTYFTASGNAAWYENEAESHINNIPARGGLPAGNTMGVSGSSCWAFAQYCFIYTFGRNFYTANQVSEPSFGDAIAMNGGAHYAIYLGEDDNYYYVYDANYDYYCGVRYNGTFSKAKWSISTIYHATNYDLVYNTTKVPDHAHTYNNLGKCTKDGCGYQFPYTSGFDSSYAGIYKVTSDSASARSGPYEACSKEATLSTGTTISVKGRVINSYHTDKDPHYWYQATYNGQTVYVYSTHLTKQAYASITAGNYYLKHKSTGKYLAVDGGVDADRQNVSVSGYTGGNEMKLAISAASRGYMMRPHCSGTRVVNPYGDTVTGGMNINLYPAVSDASASSQWWGFEKVSGGYILHNMQNENIVLAVDGTNVVTAAYTGAADQIWTLETAGGTTPHTHTYDNACDTTCNGCGETRSVPDHVYDNACDASCNSCGATRGVIGHTYDNDFDTVCNTCGSTRNLPFDSYGTTGDCIWTLKDGVLTISGNGKTADYTYSNKAPWGTSITKATIADGVTSIGDYSFYNCSSLTSVIIPDSVTSIEFGAFRGCTGLTSITIGNSVTSIANYAFYGCTSLSSITIPNSVTSIGAYSFSDCTGLTSITIPFVGAKKDGASNTTYDTYFGYIFGATSIYSSCIPSSLKTVVITDGVTFIDNNAFYNCSGLTSITIPDSVTSVGKSAFSGCTGLTAFTIPKSVTSIDANAFANCSALTSINIPDSVTSIGEGAFYGCSGLTSIFIPDSVTTIGISAFSNCPTLSSIHVSKENSVYHSNGNCLIETGSKTLISGCKNSVIPDDASVTSIDANAFANCSALTSINIPDSVTSIGDYAFYNCSGLTSINISDGVIYIGEYAFSGCDNLASITIPDSVNFIGHGAFSYCNTLSSITIPDSIAYIGACVLDGTAWFDAQPDGLVYIGKIAYMMKGTCPRTIALKEGTKKIAGFAFNWCTELTSITIPNSVNFIGDYAFYNCTSLTSITIPDSVTSIEGGAFNSCTGLTSVTIGNSVISIGDYTFSSCSSLTSVTIGNSVTSIGAGAFYGCIDLTSVTIPDSVISIGPDAFYGCTGLTSVTIPDSVTSIGYRAFENCTTLTSITIPDSVTSIDSSTFYGCTGLTSVTIPNSLASIDMYAFYKCEALSDVWYVGTQEDQQSIFIDINNEVLTSATWHYIDGYCDATCNACDATREASAHEFGAPKVAGNELQYTCIGCGTVKTQEKELLSTTDSIIAIDGKTTLQVPAGSEALIHKETQLSVEALSVEDNQKIADKTEASLALVLGENQRIACTFDVKILLDGDVIQPGGKVKITLEIPETAKKYNNLTVVYVDDDGKVTPCESTLNPDGTISFLAEHFSNYSLVGELITYTPGDVDDIPGVTTDDAIYVLFAVNFPESYPVSQPIDFDGNGVVDTDDAIYLLFHVNFPESYPLH